MLFSAVPPSPTRARSLRRPRHLPVQISCPLCYGPGGSDSRYFSARPLASGPAGARSQGQAGPAENTIAVLSEAEPDELANADGVAVEELPLLGDSVSQAITNLTSVGMPWQLTGRAKSRRISLDNILEGAACGSQESLVTSQCSGETCAQGEPRGKPGRALENHRGTHGLTCTILCERLVAVPLATLGCEDGLGRDWSLGRSPCRAIRPLPTKATGLQPRSFRWSPLPDPQLPISREVRDGSGLLKAVGSEDRPSSLERPSGFQEKRLKLGRRQGGLNTAEDGDKAEDSTSAAKAKAKSKSTAGRPKDQ